jgi:acyl-homoserine lactone synthase
MIHVVTAANRALYVKQLDEMHRLRWRFFIEQRKWTDLAAAQAEPGFERDEFDDDRAVYLLALGEDGAVNGSMRLRPTDDTSLIGKHFPHLLAPECKPRLGPSIWEITRSMRTPEYRGSDGELRLKINCASCEFALSRGIERYVAVIDTFLLPAMRALNRDKHRVLGAPHQYAEGEMIAVELRPCLEWLEMCRERGGFDQPMMFEQPAPVGPPTTPPEHQERLATLVRRLSEPQASNLMAQFAATERPRATSVAEHA